MTQRIATCGLLTALAMIFSYIESLFSFSFLAQGIKLGLANLIVLTGLYYMKRIDVFFVLLCRIFLTAFLFGNMSSLLYSLCGGVLSFLVMNLMISQKWASMISVSIIGGVFHNIGQLLIAMLVVENFNLIFELPILLIAGSICGYVIGTLGKYSLPYLKKMLR